MVNKIRIVRGTTNIFNIVVNDENGAIYKTSNGERVIFGVKRDTDDADFVIKKEAVFSTDEGAYVVTITPDDTIGCMCGAHVYDVGLEAGANFFSIIEPSPFEIEPNVTYRGCTG